VVGTQTQQPSSNASSSSRLALLSSSPLSQQRLGQERITELKEGDLILIHRPPRSSDHRSIHVKMLQRAASNAYSWWWASHIRSTQSKWLDANLQGQLSPIPLQLLMSHLHLRRDHPRRRRHPRRRPAPSPLPSHVMMRLIGLGACRYGESSQDHA
jgi:hypothetical protein